MLIYNLLINISSNYENLDEWVPLELELVLLLLSSESSASSSSEAAPAGISDVLRIQNNLYAPHLHKLHHQASHSI